jgi:TolB-like protein
MGMESPVSSDIFLFEGFRFDRRGALFRRADGTEAPVAIGPRALDILGVLVARAGDVVSKDGISAAVWPGRTVEGSNLTVQIAALRRVLDQGQSRASCIQTIGGRGYRFAAPVTRAEGQDRWRPPMMPPPRLSIVVLPLVNLSSDPEQEYFADGITDDLTTDLSRISGSFVIARNTAFTYKSKAVDAKRIGRELGVRYVLEGSVRRYVSRVRVNAQLVDAETGAHLWAERFDRESGDLLQIQDEITGHIASQVRAELVEVESNRSLRERPNDPDAVDLAMQARALLNKPPSPEQNERARRLCERALALDANNVDVLASLAGSYVTSAHDLNIGDWSEWHRQATDAVNRALTIDPRNARVFLVKSRVLAYSDALEYRGQIEAAIDAVETAIALDPNLAIAYGWLGRQGRSSRADGRRRRAGDAPQPAGSLHSELAL